MYVRISLLLLILLLLLLLLILDGGCMPEKRQLEREGKDIDPLNTINIATLDGPQTWRSLLPHTSGKQAYSKLLCIRIYNLCLGIRP